MNKLILLLVLTFFSITSPVLASDQFITVVNPVRISPYNNDHLASLRAQYGVISQYRLPATWLLTYDVLNRPEIVTELKRFSPNQEIGIFLEITSEFSKVAGVGYHSTGSWHFANSVFLSGYTQEERIKFIDKVFSKFKERFGYYPVSVGAWWIDSFSLKYMHDKYGVIGNLSCADQYSTDNYQIWGTYWSTPYYPSAFHSGLPAKNSKDKIGIVTIQWASRHPRNGYYSSLYSLQDYLTTPDKHDSSYFKSLLEVYAHKNKNSFGQITVGLEADLNPEIYQKEFLNQIQIVSSDNATKLTMADFSKWYKDRFPEISPEHTIDSEGMLWYQSPFYRLGIDKTNKKIIDFRVYPSDFKEPYFEWPNRERNLRINIPALIDSVQDSSETWAISDINIKTTLKYFESVNKPPSRLFKSKLVKIQKIGNKWRIEMSPDLTGLNEGILFNDWSIETKHLLRAPKSLLRMILSFNWEKLNRENFWISPEEIIGLDKLKQLPMGKVLVYDHECLQCEYFGSNKPAVFGNYRDYVGKFSQKKIIYNAEIIDSSDRNVIKDKLQSMGISYVYLTKYDQVNEFLKLSPGDYGVEKIFENAAVQIWKVVK
ncbi:MAG: hypothetical protein AAB697_01525 [Patescibacteria group bacterium]